MRTGFELDLLPDSHPAALSPHFLNRMGEEYKMKKILWIKIKTARSLTIYYYGQNR